MKAPQESWLQEIVPDCKIQKSSYFFSRILGLGPKPSPPQSVSNTTQQPQQQIAGQPTQPTAVQPEPQQKKKKGFFGKIVGVFKGDETDKPPSSDPTGNQGQTRR